MGVADLCNAYSDWSTVKKCRPTIRRDVGDIGQCQRQTSSTFVGKCQQATNRMCSMVV